MNMLINKMKLQSRDLRSSFSDLRSSPTDQRSSSTAAQNPMKSEIITMFKLVNEPYRKEACKFKQQAEEAECQVDCKLVSDCVPPSKRISSSADSTSSFDLGSSTDSDSSSSKDLPIHDNKESWRNTKKILGVVIVIKSYQRRIQSPKQKPNERLSHRYKIFGKAN